MSAALTVSDHSVFQQVLFLESWNTRVVILGVSALGAAGGAVGSFMLLRRRALIGDALSHATLPGVVLAFLLAPLLGFDPKSLGVLLFGALVTGVIGILTIQYLARSPRVTEDAAIGTVLSCFFGLGVALLGLAQQESTSSAAGLETFIYGKTASMLASDAALIAIVASVSLLSCAALFKELRLICFDADFARGQGLPTTVFDLILLALVIAVVIVGLQAVGLILVIAILIIPAAAARFWTNSTGRMLILAAIIGGAGGWIGAGLSALAPRLPAGALVVLVLASAFVVSLLFGRRRGVAQRAFALRQHRKQIQREHALRAAWECVEETGSDRIWLTALATHRGWSLSEARRHASTLAARGLARVYRATKDVSLELTATGQTAAAAVVRRHRLWEHYLIRRADFDAGHVDRGADELEHLLPPDLLLQLETELAQTRAPLPASPHQLGSAATGDQT